MSRCARSFVIGALAALFVASLASVAGCKTTIDSSASDTTVVALTTTVPTGTADKLLPRLLIEAGKLSDIIGSRGDRGAQIDVINALYDAVRPKIAAVDSVAVLDFDGAIELCRKGEKFNRPADADKCFRNLTALSDNFLEG